MLTATSLLMIATALGSPDATPELAEPVAEAAATTTELATDGAPQAPVTSSGDPLYDRLFAAQPEPTEVSDQPSLPQLPPWLWVASMAGLGGLYFWRQRQKRQKGDQGQVEILGHTRVGPRARLTVVRVPGEDGRMRRLLVSTGEGAPSLVAELGCEGSESPERSLQLEPTPGPSAAPKPFHLRLDEAVAHQDAIVMDELSREDVVDDEVLPEGAGLGAVPPPRVPVWNETPDEFASDAEPARPPVVQQPEPMEAARPRTAIEALDSMLDDGDAPEMVLDVSWDPETGWSGLPDMAPAPEPELPRAAERDEDEDEGASESWEALLDHQISRAPEPPLPAGVRPASRAAFEALLSGGRRKASAGAESRPSRARPPQVHTVKPLRPRAAHQRRTPYDDMLVDDPIEPSVTLAPSRPSAPEADARISPMKPTRSTAEVHDLVAEVLEERAEPPSEQGARGNGVVELARYLRRQVAP